jgi:hypothetical protein
MIPFRVWIHPLDGGCRVRVDGDQNAKWLVNRLSESFVFKSCQPLDTDPVSAESIFQVPYGSQLTGSQFARLLASIPEVRLVSTPA